MSLNRLSALCLTVVSLGMSAGCAGSVRLDTDAHSYDSGDRVQLTLANAGLKPVGFSPCSTRLEVRAGADWKTVVPARPATCTEEAGVLRVNHDGTWWSQLEAGLTPGEYRYVAEVTVDGQPRAVPTIAFVIEG